MRQNHSPGANAAILRRARARIERLAERARQDGLDDFVILVGDRGLGRRPVVELLARPDAVGLAAESLPEIVRDLADPPPADLPLTVVVTSRRGGTTVFDLAGPGEVLGSRTEARG